MSSQLSTKKTLLLGAAAVVVVLGAAWFLLVAPQRSDADKLQAQVDAAQAELAQKKAELARPSATIRIKANDLFRLSKALPTVGDTAGVLLDVDRLAGKHKLTFLSLTPQPSLTGTGTGYVQQPYAVVLEGRFGDVSKFVRDLRKLVVVKRGRLNVRGRVYTIDKVELKEPSSEKKFPVVNAALNVNAYSYAGVAVPPGDASQSTTTSTGTVAAGATP
jgi:Tfp pilus assembly protein PilO